MFSALQVLVFRPVALGLIVMAFLSPASAAGASIVIDHRTIDMTDKVIPQHWLDAARSLSVSFGHQSVGANIVDGLEILARQNPGRYRLTVQAQPNPDWFAAHKGLGHYLIGHNGDANSKTADFTRHLQLQAGKANVAMMKLCFADIGPGTAPEKVFASYRETMERLERTYPSVRFVWWTEPLWRSGNVERNRYNALVRDYALAHGKPLYDIADIETHDPSGQLVRRFYFGEPKLYDGYTYDGGHLVPDAQVRAARAWWWLLARLAGWPGPKG